MEEDAEIAIVGVGCRFPGADNLQEFWRVLVNGENHVTDIPPDRWNMDAHFSDDKDAQGKMYVKKAGLLNGYDHWDNTLFGVSDSEAAKIDPQQRYVLECTHMALEDGGITRSQISGSQTGVYIGVMNDDYKSLINIDTPGEGQNAYSATGTSTTVIASRVAYTYNLRGPCMVVDTACSSALIAIHLGCQAIRTAECERVICGGVNSLLNPETLITLCKARMLSPTGQCQTFCDTADGYAKGEGCGVVVLMKLKHAREQNAKIWGVIRTGSNQDGAAAHPITAPSGDQQYALLEHVYSKHGVHPGSIQYIEAHGTGTSIGDPIEVNALGEFFSKFRKNKHAKLLIGSVKSNIGHTESAAGVASLIKVLLMMSNGQVVPSLHVKTDYSNVHKAISLEEHNLSIPVDVVDWPRDTHNERRASINSFGFGGSNCHAIVTQYPKVSESYSDPSSLHPYFINISAPTVEDLRQNLESFQVDLDTFPIIELNDISYTSLCHRDVMMHRTLVYGRNVKDLKSQIQSRKMKLVTPSNHNHLIFLFCGVGTTWPGMCKEMMQNVQFREKVREIDALLEPLANFKIEDKFSSIQTTYEDQLVNHISIFAAQVALTSVWKAFGVIPDVVIGQSIGEVAAAHVSGLLSLEEAVEIIYKRSIALNKCTGGSMMVVGNRPLSEIESLCSEFKTVEVAVYSSPMACTLSGDPKELNDIAEQVRSIDGDHFIRKLNVNTAFHSSFVDCCKEELENDIGNIRAQRPTNCVIYSTVTGTKAVNGDFTTGRYWARNIRQPVFLYQAIQNAMKDEDRNLVLEIGPRQVLKAHFGHILQNRSGVCLPSMNVGKELPSIYDTLVELYQMGYNISLDPFISSLYSCTLSIIPRYRFAKTKQLFLPQTTKQYLFGGSTQTDQSHMYIKRRISGSNDTFEICIGPESMAFIFDHRFHGTVLLPGATYIDTALFVASTILKKPINSLAVSAEFLKPFIHRDNIKENIEVEVQRLDDHSLQIMCSKDDVVYATAIGKVKGYARMSRINIDKIAKRCTTKRYHKHIYDRLKEFGFEYGHSMKLLNDSISNQSECIVALRVTEGVISEFCRSEFHTAVVDAMFQSVALIDRTNKSETFIPAKAETVRLLGSLQEDMVIYTHLEHSNRSEKHFSIELLTKEGFVLAGIRRFVIKMLNPGSQDRCCKYVLRHSTYEQRTQKVDKDGFVYIISHKILPADTWFKDILSGERFVFIHSPTQIEKASATAVVINIPQINMIEKTSITLDTIAQTFVNLKEMLMDISQLKMACPVYILTADVNICQGRDFKMELGLNSVFWGMIRSVRLEGLLDDICLVDVDRTDADYQTIRNVLLSENLKNIELGIKGKMVYILVLEEDEHPPLYKELHMDMHRDAILQSNVSEPCEMWYKFKSCGAAMSTINSKSVQLRMLYVVKLEDAVGEKHDDSSLINDVCGNSNDVIAIEGTGLNNSNEEIIFCYPTIVTTRYVYVPKKCCVSRNKIPNYRDGMLCQFALFYNLASTVKKGSFVLLLGAKNLEVLEEMLKKRRCLVYINSMNSGMSSLTFIDVIIISCKVELGEIESILARCSKSRYMISLNDSLPSDTRIRLQVENPKLVIREIRVSDIFTRDGLCEIMPAVLQFARCRSVMDLYKPKYSINSINLKRYKVQVSKKELFRRNACYIVVGGLTGLGSILVQLMAEMGAGHIAIFNRRVMTDEQAYEINQLKKRYQCQIYTFQVDVSNLTSVQKGILELSKSINTVPIRGIFHGAGTLSDAILQNQTLDGVKTVFNPKIMGSWNLHISCLNLPLDFFVMHSSIASVIGNVGQSNYSAANSFLDALANYRQSNGLCGQSLNWGPISTGMGIGSKSLLNDSGFQVLSVDEVKHYFIDALMSNEAQYLIVKADWNKIMDTGKYPLKFSHLLTWTQSNDERLESFLQSGQDRNIREAKLKTLLREKVCEEFVMAETELKDDMLLSSLGFDSLSSQSFVSNIYAVTSIRIPIMKLLDQETCIDSLVQFCLDNAPKEHEFANDTDEHVNKSSMDILDKSIVYTQLTVLQKYFKQRDNPMNVDIFEIEIRTKTSVKQWNDIIKRVLMTYPKLRTRYFETDDGIRTVVDSEVADIPRVHRVDYPKTVKGSDVMQDNVNVLFDLEKEYPVKFQVAFKTSKTFLRIILHKVISDMNCLALIFSAIQKAAFAIQNKTDLPSVRPSDVVAIVRRSLSLKWTTAETFWRSEVDRELKVVTIGKNSSLPSLKTSDYRVIKQNLTAEQCVHLNQYLHRRRLTLFHVAASLFQLLLHLETLQECICINTLVDIRGHVPEIKDQMIRSLNLIPAIADFQETLTVGDFISDNGVKIQTAYDYGFYPEDLIMNLMQPQHLKRLICRHYLIMDNLQVMNEMVSQHWKVKLKRVLHRRVDYETKIFITYDFKKNQLSCDLGFCTSICDIELGERMMKIYMWMLRNVHILDHCDIKSIHMMYSKSCVTVPPSQLSLCQPESTDVFSNKSSVTTVLKGTFRRLTSNGSSQNVLVELQHNNRGVDLLVGENVIEIAKLMRVELTRMQGTYCLRLHGSSDTVLLQTQSETKATEWMRTIENQLKKIKSMDHNVTRL